MSRRDFALTPRHLIVQRFARSRVTAIVAVALVTAVLLQTLAGVDPATASPRSAPPMRPGSTASLPPTAKHPAVGAPAALSQSIARQIGLYKGSAPDPTIPRAAVNAATGPAPEGSFSISPAVRHLLTSGLGLDVGSGSRLVGGRYSHYVAAAVGAPRSLRFGLPAGDPVPTFPRSVLVSDTRSGTLTFEANTATGLGASVSIAIPHAATTTLGAPGDLSGSFEIPELSVLGGTAALKGKVTDMAGTLHLTATGYDTAPTSLDHGHVSVNRDLRVTLDNQQGLSVAGLATLGSGPAGLPVALHGTMSSAAGWSLLVSPADHATPWQPVSGLFVAPSFSGALTDRAGAVNFDVTTGRPVTWAPTAVTAENVTRLEYSDLTPPTGTDLPAGYRTGDTWLGTSGQFAVSSGPAGTFRGAGQLAVDLSSGRAAVRAAAGAAPLTAGRFAHRLFLTGAALSGALNVDRGHLVGDLAIATPHNGSLRLATRTLTGALTSPPAPIQSSSRPAGHPGPTRFSAAADTTASSTYTVSSSIFNYLTQTLGIALSSPTLSGTVSGSTVTVQVAAPTDVVLPLPTGSTSLAFGPTTLSVDESSNTLTLSSTATAAGATADLSVTVANADTSQGGADITGTVAVTGLSVFGTPVSVQGQLEVNGTSPSFTLTGTLASPVTLTSGVVLESGAAITLAAGTASANRLSISGTVDLGSGATILPVTVNGTISGLSDWSLTVSDPGAPTWQPAPGLSVTPDFKGAISDASGKVTFDLRSANSATWTPTPNTSVAVTSLEVSNDVPPSGVNCPSDLEDGSLWLDAQGTVTYTPPDASAPLLSIDGEACVAPGQGSFTVTTDASGNLAPPAGSTFTLTDVALDVNGNFTTNTFSVDGSASLGGVGSAPALTAGLSFDSDGSFVAGVSVPDLSQLGLSGLSGSGAVWVSTKDNPNFVPSSIPGFASLTSPIHLRQGLDVTFNYTLDPTEVSQLRSWGIPVPATATAVASLGPSGFTADIDLGFGSGESGVTLFDANGFVMYLNAITVGVTLSSSPEVDLSGTATLHVPSVTGDATSSPSDVLVNLNASLALASASIKVGFSISGECTDGPCPWQDAFGIKGLTISTFAVAIGVDFETAIPTPTLAFSLDNVILPTDISQPIGLQPNAEISVDVNVDLEQPVVHFGLTAPSGQAALYPLEILGPNSGVQQAIAIDTADFWLAPTGGDLANGQHVNPGVSIQFDATFAGVQVRVYAAIDPTALSVDATVDISNFNLGPVTFSAGPGQPAVLFVLHIGTDGFKFQFEGGFSFAGFDFAATIDLEAVSTMVGASASVSVTAGLPAFLQIGANLAGSFSLDSSGLNLSVSGSGFLIVAGDNLGSVSFSFSFSSGLAWAAITQAYQQVAQAFQNAYGWAANQITSALAGLQYDATQVASALNYIDVSAAQIGQDIANFFAGTSDGSLAADLSQAGLSPDQIAGALQSAFNDADSTVAYWLNQLGYDSNQIAGALQSVFNDAEYQIINTLGQIGITSQNIINGVASFFTGNGSYWISTSDPNNLWVPLYLDVSGASTSPGAPVIQWTWNGGYNQDWYVVPTDSGYAELVNRNSGQCLTVPGDDGYAGTSLVQWPCDGDYGQQWLIGGGTYPGWNEAGWTAGIQSRLDGLFADVYNASGSAGDGIDQWYWNGNWNQSWYFTQAVG